MFGGDSATRKPLFLLRLPGMFLFRFAARRFLALLFQLPPRSASSALTSPERSTSMTLLELLEPSAELTADTIGLLGEAEESLIID